MSLFVLPAPLTSSGCRIGYSNLLERGTVLASSENPAYPIENAFDWNASDFFRPLSGGVTSISLTLDEGATANYFAFYGQDVYEQGGSISLEYWDGSGWVSVAGVAPSSNAPSMVFFDPVASDQWRVQVVCSGVFNLAALAFGEYLELPHGQYLGQTPPRLARSSTFVNSVSDGGTFLGRSVVSTGVSLRLVLQYAPDDWVWENWPAFVEHAEKKPFFFCPNFNTRASDVAFCWVVSDITPPAHTQYGFMGTQLALRGVVA